ncbi:hypothetical protein GGTG_05928 [Gaeumannomyces tritici R3-111a-1]|uniref:O-methyltransferase C-terminal domain-containing protein n=1 Tax=Gaeumannomyces tritici (strain R3-111a-1) TaxID=644352 RepID=J3NXC1_GAET3|nr:hypothetical protein GGTG_05928 [Gaeumannomyces tritici R3-111a-1]EJT76003.1 hypothetical protein GGTG_05928 [Gaeumannomyces tritici R3-111a-1]
MSALRNALQQLLAIVRGSPSVGQRHSTTKTNNQMPGTGSAGLVGLAEALLESAKAMQANPQDKELRMSMAKLAKRIGTEAAGPESIIPMYAVAFGEIGATYQFMEWKLFDKIPKDKSISYQELADSVGADLSVVSRLGGMLVASGRLIQTSPGHVKHSSTSHMFANGHNAGNLFRILLEHGLRGYLHWPEYFAKYGPHEPAGPTHNPFTFSHGHPEMGVFDVVALDEERARIFASSMRSGDSISARFGGPASLYDFSWLGAEAAGSAEGAPLLVDVGGSHGDTLKHIMQAVPSLPQERCVLQDRAEVVEESARAADPALARVRRVAHDFNEEQPVRGALVYLLRRVLHDYSDPICVRVLARLAAALPAGDARARVLIMDQVLADPPSPANAAADLVMFNIGGKERSPAGFEDIVAAAGMRVVKIHRKEGSEVGVVECAAA